MDNPRFANNSKQLPYDPNRLLPDDRNILVLDEDGNLSRKSTDSFGVSSTHRRQDDGNYDAVDDDTIEPNLMITTRDDEPDHRTSPMANNLVSGILDAETVAKHMSKMGKTADATTISYLTLTLPVSQRNHSILSRR